jgi:hypothetical protein
MNDESLRRTMGENARQVSDRFSLEQTVSRWDEVFEKVATQSRRNPEKAPGPLKFAAKE